MRHRSVKSPVIDDLGPVSVESRRRSKSADLPMRLSPGSRMEPREDSSRVRSPSSAAVLYSPVRPPSFAKPTPDTGGAYRLRELAPTMRSPFEESPIPSLVPALTRFSPG